MDQPEAFSSKWTTAWTLQLNIQIYFPRRLHRSEVGRPETGERVGFFVGNAKAKQKKKTPKSVYPGQRNVK